MYRQILWTIGCLLSALVIAGCTPAPASSTATANPTPDANLPNPASVFCEDNGGRVDLRTDQTGAVAGVCVFPDGSECDEWAYYRGECSPGEPTAGANLPNPASVFCEENGGRVELRSDAAGAVAGVCVFPNGSECDEWAYYRGECSPGQPAAEVTPTAAGNAAGAASTAIPTPLPIDPAGYQGWWTYTQTSYGFAVQLPPDWVVDETTTADPLLSGHLLWLRPEQSAADDLRLRLTFRRAGEETLLWPTGVGQGEFVAQGTLQVAGEPARRVFFVCPSGQLQSVWYHGADGPNVARGDLEFGFILSHSAGACRAGEGLQGKTLLVGEMIVASLSVPDPQAAR